MIRVLSISRVLLLCLGTVAAGCSGIVAGTTGVEPAQPRSSQFRPDYTETDPVVVANAPFGLTKGGEFYYYPPDPQPLGRLSATVAAQVAFSPDAVALVTSAGEASVIGVQGAVSTFNLQTTAVLAIALNPTSTLLAVATSTNMGPNITVYNTQNGSIKQSLSVPYFGSITTLAYDLESNLYVAVRSVSGSEIAVYSEGTVRTITAGLNDPKSMQFDNSNNLYVLNYDHDVTVYASGSGSVARTIPGEPGEGPFSIALDSSNDLAIGYSGFIQVFKSGSTTPILVASPHAIYHVTAMAFADGYLYGASSNVETIDIFAPFLKRKPGRDGPIGKLFATNPIGIGVLTEGSTSSGLHNLALAPSSIDFDRKWPDGWDGPAIRHGTISY